ncbi:conserved Plasmodium protein, unknown function [Plasmodium berghei]|uniref:Uncharacterized protein n=2 Tax=Plasmodium berghei TaxID=5821 RepID=A0A509AHT4_PLABA|nr:conserved Plasmodium protein, unknown function [Plasmodium berghei ANKA]SCM21534.1 conserved Plasmodium protein, unknown function [Plasmodium berghei]SCN24733.1 conserved Plasmodium protein, unknown function [Plasmodium berghei]SCO59872.1 conserved Plasmodium protein, unknown function [Plasmodium berghei]SCO61192.1 conserved Plasmodium protein, unknown function [Plasmodium berghei]VUC55455.1 conserved Plasmodium protein, unknown function [Plasmodium berghei ANKA]|eukprot:XP_034421268.1 conserved Plasmodium protein, unknown function [Plasmodium berghei ANKA]
MNFRPNKLLLLVTKGTKNEIKKFVSSFSGNVEEVLSDNGNNKKWKKEIENLRKNENNKEKKMCDVDIKELNYIIQKEKRKKIQDRIKRENNKEENFDDTNELQGSEETGLCNKENEENINLFQINTFMKNINLNKSKMLELEECINYYDKWSTEQINYINMKTAEKRTVVINKNNNDSNGYIFSNLDKNMDNINNYYDLFFENDEHSEKLKNKNYYNSLFNENDPRLTWDVQDDIFFSNLDIEFFNKYSDHNYSQFLETLDHKKNVYLDYIDKRKPVKFLNKYQIIEVLNDHAKNLFLSDSSQNKKYDIFINQGNITNNPFINENTTSQNNSKNNIKMGRPSHMSNSIIFSKECILHNILKINYTENNNFENYISQNGEINTNDLINKVSSTQNDTTSSAFFEKCNKGNNELYFNLIKRIEFIAMSFSVQEIIFIISFFYIKKIPQFDILNKFIQNFLISLYLLKVDDVLILLKIYGTWKNAYDDFIHVLLIYFFNLKMMASNQKKKTSHLKQSISSTLNKKEIQNKGNSYIDSKNGEIFSSYSDRIFLEICLNNNIKINNSLQIFYSKNNLKCYDKKYFLLLFQSFYKLTDYKNQELFFNSIQNFPFFFENFKLLNKASYLRNILYEIKNGDPNVKLSLRELEKVLGSIIHMNSSEFVENFKNCLASYYHDTDREFLLENISNDIQKYKIKKNNDEKFSELILNANVCIMNFSIFYNLLIKNLKELMVFSFFNTTHLFDTIKNASFSENQISVLKNDIYFPCLVKTKFRIKSENEEISNKLKFENYSQEIETTFIENNLDIFNDITKLKYIFTCEKEDINNFLYHYKKISVQNVPISFIVNSIYFINEYLSNFKNIFETIKNFKTDILYILSFLYSKYLVILNGLNDNNKKKKLLFSFLEKIIPPFGNFNQNEIIDIIKELNNFIPFCEFYKYRELDQIKEEMIEKNNPIINLQFCKNNVIISQNIINTMFLIFINYFNYIKENYISNNFPNVLKIILTTSVYIHIFKGGNSEYENHFIHEFIFLKKKKNISRNVNNIPKLAEKLLYNLLDTIISFFLIYKSKYYCMRLYDSQLIQMISSLSYFYFCLSICENKNIKDQNGSKQNKAHIFYNDIFSLFIDDLCKLNFEEISELNKLKIFEATSIIFILNTLNTISTNKNEIIFLLNKTIKYIVENYIYISTENYKLITNSCQNLKRNQNILLTYDMFDFLHYQKLMTILKM